MHSEIFTNQCCISQNSKLIDMCSFLRALSGILNAVEVLHRNGFVQRDIKGDNILVGKDGDGILVDFGLCIKSADASLPEFLGDGTAEYSAPEVAKKLSGSNLCTELFSLFVVFVESVMMRHPFGGEVRWLIEATLSVVRQSSRWGGGGEKQSRVYIFPDIVSYFHGTIQRAGG